MTHVSSTPYSPDLTEWDEQTYRSLTSRDLTPAQQQRILEPAEVFTRQKSILAVHWHPEFVPIDMIERRIRATFPIAENELIIPTQHNELTSFAEFTGVEVDCYSPEFNLKVQLLIHFHGPRLAGEQADVFRSMLVHTYRYRSRQLFEFMDTILDPIYEERMQHAAAQAGADEELVQFVRAHTQKVKTLFERYEDQTPPDMIRNKLLTYFFDALRDVHDPQYVQRARSFLREIKAVVKANFSNQHFYVTQEVIEEVRRLGGGIVIPHPEQFWPILLADYDVDGYEVWNPQSRQYTEFLINVVGRLNRSGLHGDRPLLVFMGDDCHMGEKAKDPRFQDRAKAAREIGVQPAWDDLTIRKSLITANANRRRVISEYRDRLCG